MKKFNRYSLPPWLSQVRAVLGQFIIPLTVFQAFRTLFLPSTIDVFLLAILLGLSFAYYYEWL
ncbi:hypothetical protein LC087_08365 [Bacillus carboniphilus]|uniref:Uncharacterized protein n=1 Tax=Bacillus carboniphilus TaxID=86663 RepID=A0ABY9JXI9_9BACI|nr:hypothetical protein [Bacillus carboniphilus]WLR44094.1 hypothetical protein LC087_08365 [Bacillus carboniphilus]